ncbi:nuclear transport factor 2 family protein [Nocardia sp. NBC_01730]|uniref:nuclear transport factor 2 family protein n=1 Tax=Nocardia sp. NBC_01730 TaxID=2975998 RepID=UPI002E0FF30B|nr:nuclear transport factor 2 family protein [Nocardia sp. NBC_01730]
MLTPHDFRSLADRVEIEALRGEFTDAVMMRDFDRLASLFTDDAVLRIPDAGIELAGRTELQTKMRLMQDAWDYFVQHTHPGAIEIDGDTATGRAHICELGRLKSGSSHLNYAIYHDRYRRTADGWKFTERVYEIRYLDSSPLPGSPPGENGLGVHVSAVQLPG